MSRQCNMCPITERCNATRQGGNDQTEQTIVTKQHPVFVNGIERGSINQALVKSNCPMLLHNAVMAEWDTGMRPGQDELTLNHVGNALPCTYDRVPVIAITEIDISNLREAWHRIPQWYTMSDHGHGHSLYMRGILLGEEGQHSLILLPKKGSTHKLVQFTGFTSSPSHTHDVRTDRDIALLQQSLRERLMGKKETPYCHLTYQQQNELSSQRAVGQHVLVLIVTVIVATL